MNLQVAKNVKAKTTCVSVQTSNPLEVTNKIFLISDEILYYV